MRYYVRLVQGKGLISRLIEFKDSDWPSHVEMLVCQDDDSPIEVLSSRYPSGVAYRQPYAYPIRREAWYTCPVPSDACERAWNAMRRAMIGKRYDWRDILGIAGGADWHADGRFICSEAVAYAFEIIGVPLFNAAQPVHRIRPAHFLLTPLLKLYLETKSLYRASNYRR